MSELIGRLSDDLHLSPEERGQLIPSGSISVIASRVHWAKTYLKQAGLLDQPKRGIVRMTKRGKDLLATDPSRIDLAVLRSFPEFVAFLGKTKPNSGTEVASGAPSIEAVGEPSATPEEQITSASKTLEEALTDALLTRVLEGTPEFFEKLIINLLMAMGYGGSRTDAGERLGRTGDGGVDGVISEDQLGLDRIYLQAKRYYPGNTVGSEAVQAFIGALVGRGAKKGVMITTSGFSRAAVAAAARSGELRLVLVDGEQLTSLMVRFGVGVRVSRTVEIKVVDQEYFGALEDE